MSRLNPILPYEGSESYLYISFCAGDAKGLQPILEELVRNGCRVWYDVDRYQGIQKAANADQIHALLEKINGCTAMLCIVSDLSGSDPIASNEMRHAVSRGIRVIPVMLGNPELSPASKFMLGAFHFYNTGEDVSEERLRELGGEIANQVGQLVGGGSGAETRSEAVNPPEPKSRGKHGIGGFLSGLFSGRRKKTEPPAKQAEPKTDKVNFSILSPRAVKPDSYGVIDLHVYTEAQREVVERAIRESNGLVSETSKSGFSVKRETSITARLESDDVEIKDPLETQVWNGESLRFDFRFFVPADYSRSQVAFTCYIECNGIPVTRLNFISAVSKTADQTAIPAKVTRSDFRKAFISYCRRDEQRMLQRVLGIQELVPEMKFWLDKQSMDAGDLWREEIRKAILISDILLLFWSVAASRSSEVEKEWRYGLSFIAPVPLDPPAECPPPEALGSLNFSVRAFAQNEITEKLSFYNSDNIQII